MTSVRRHIGHSPCCQAAALQNTAAQFAARHEQSVDLEVPNIPEVAIEPDLFCSPEGDIDDHDE